MAFCWRGFILTLSVCSTCEGAVAATVESRSGSAVGSEEEREEGGNE